MLRILAPILSASAHKKKGGIHKDHRQFCVALQRQSTNWTFGGASRRGEFVVDVAEDVCAVLGNEMATGVLRGGSENADSGFFA